MTDGTQPAAFGSPALDAQAKGQSFSAGLDAHAQGPATGILVRSAATGIGSVNQSDSYAAVAAQNQGGGAAVSAVANGNQVLLGGGSSTAPPARVVGHNAGALTRTSSGDLWYCGASAASGWRKLAGTGTAGALHVLPTPVRADDSRPGTTPNVGTKAPLAANGVRSLDLKANGTGVPAGATAALVTVFLVSATAGNGNFTIWRGGAARPQANTLVWGGAAGRHTVTAVTALDAAATVQVHANLSTHVVVDVVGYYR